MYVSSINFFWQVAFFGKWHATCTSYYTVTSLVLLHLIWFSINILSTITSRHVHLYFWMLIYTAMCYASLVDLFLWGHAGLSGCGVQWVRGSYFRTAYVVRLVFMTFCQLCFMDNSAHFLQNHAILWNLHCSYVTTRRPIPPVVCTVGPPQKKKKSLP